MADIVGVDHVSIGPDQYVTPGSVVAAPRCGDAFRPRLGKSSH
jgi:hypothetical protein